MNLVHVGQHNLLDADRIFLIIEVTPKRTKKVANIVATAQQNNEIVDLTGRFKRRSIVLLDNDKVVYLSISPHVLEKRIEEQKKAKEQNKIKNSDE